MKTQLDNGITVDTWYDRQSRNWVTQTFDADGNQIADAEYSGDRKSAQIDHQQAIATARRIDQELTETMRDLINIIGINKT